MSQVETMEALNKTMTFMEELNITPEQRAEVVFSLYTMFVVMMTDDIKEAALIGARMLQQVETIRPIVHEKLTSDLAERLGVKL